MAQLECAFCGAELEDDGDVVSCAECGANGCTSCIDDGGICDACADAFIEEEEGEDYDEDEELSDEPEDEDSEEEG